MFDDFLRWIGWRPDKKERSAQKRAYAAAKVNRLTSDWISFNTSADAEIYTSLRMMRARSRQVCRDNPYAANAKRIVINNVVGAGIGLQCQVMTARGVLNDRINEMIEQAWSDWCKADNCHTAGRLGMPDILSLIMGQLVESGEVIVRKVRQPFGAAGVPYALEIIEADQLADEYNNGKLANGNQVRMGVEVDGWNRPVAYYIYPNHPGDIVFRHVDPSRLTRVPADEVIHLFLAERSPQTRGVPMLHAVLERLNDMGAYARAEIVAARASANIVGFIKREEVLEGADREDGAHDLPVEPGTFRKLLPGEDVTGFNPARPNSSMESFMNMMLRSVASGLGVSYESLSKDYSQSNYSSSRLALLDDRDRWRVLQQWLIRSFLEPVFQDWMDAAVLAGVLNIPNYESRRAKYQAVHWKPRGWSWVDPTKEVQAYALAVQNGFMTISDVIALTGSGQDAEDVFKSRASELQLLESLGLAAPHAAASVEALDAAGFDNSEEVEDESDNKSDKAGAGEDA